MTEPYISEIRSIVSKYSKIRRELSALEDQTKSLNLRKLQIEMELNSTREEEAALIDKIRTESGEEPDFYKIIQDLS
jgi:hypothetical protein